MNKLPIKTIAICASFLASNAFGAFIIIDNFSGYSANDVIAGSNGWVASGGGNDYKAVVDPTNATNMTLDRPDKVGSDSGILINSSGVNIPEGSSGTLFYRMLDTDIANDTYIGFQQAGGNSTAIDQGLEGGGIKGNNTATDLAAFGGATLITNLEGTFASPVWYNIWLVTHNNVGLSDTFDVYIQGGTNYVTQTQIGTNLAASGLSGTIGEIKVGVWSNRISALDDFYIDSTGANLNNPTTVPEPSTFAALAALCTLVLAFIRRRK